MDLWDDRHVCGPECNFGRGMSGGAPSAPAAASSTTGTSATAATERAWARADRAQLREHKKRRPALLPTDAQERKDHPIARGVLDYFPDAVAAVAHVSKVGNDQHNPGQPMHWAKGKSTDHADCIVRHLIERGTLDTDGLRHSAKVAWRALALLQTEIEDDAERVASRPAYPEVPF